ncbi:methyltransferase [Paenibacillus campi]|uniref:methyltransferase n=1 Tax=Paenibacillus campi TaxID=3106031 RepID=UPI002AFDEF86|nr:MULTISPECIES: methyltransferase [unclassified Paenibacillus]
MSRSWERQVKRNTKQLNVRRKKAGQDSLGVSKTNSEFTVYKGRNIVFPATLVLLGVVYGVMGMMYPAASTSIVLFVVTVLLYVFLGVILFLRRPYLKVGKDSLITTKFNRDRILTAANVKKIRLQKGYVVIEHSTKGGAWLFARTLNRYDTDAMAEHLRKFAATHQITVEDKL